MATTVRDVIVEASARANVCPRKRALPDDVFVSGLSLFNGVMEEFSTDGYIEAYKADVDFTPGKETVTVGEAPEGAEVDVVATRIQLPKKALYKYAGAVDWTPMQFVAYDDFYSAGYSDYVVSWSPAGPNLYRVFFKPRFVSSSNPQVKLVYNLEMKFQDGDTINLPTPYIELINRAMAYKLAVKYPRIDEAAKLNLKSEFDELKNSLTASNASNRIITRGASGGNGGSVNAWFRSGAFIGDRYF